MFLSIERRWLVVLPSFLPEIRCLMFTPLSLNDEDRYPITLTFTVYRLRCSLRLAAIGCVIFQNQLT